MLTRSYFDRFTNSLIYISIGLVRPLGKFLKFPSKFLLTNLRLYSVSALFRSFDFPFQTELKYFSWIPMDKLISHGRTAFKGIGIPLPDEDFP
ncbi:hypothetical protein DLM77_16565 [Leptospira yasudae]|uniref:Uncharacterized protein n=1 Tax=Leptospira yasudae TaxID=2202201 RepID=A0ABX9M084_9LEPT|nr:hypothetical protein DLM77_16565 [Leptospira yasudae]